MGARGVALSEVLAQHTLILRKRKNRLGAISHTLSILRLQGAVRRRAGSSSRWSSQRPLGQKTDREASGELD